MTDKDHSKSFRDYIHLAYEERKPLQFKAGGSKSFYGRQTETPIMDVSHHRGILNYEPTELILTARAGTPLTEIEQVLADQNQMLPFEPPHFGDKATLGGAIASGLSGPTRPYTGAVRDFVLGVRIINGKGEIIQFGGEVMKNVAGYDVSRLMTGALGTLGLLLEISIKVLPKPAQAITLSRELDVNEAQQQMLAYAQQALPISAACHDGQKMFLRLSGASLAVAAAKKQLGGVELDDSATFWRSLREQQHEFFSNSPSLYRLSVPASTPITTFSGEQFIDWGGAQRWLKTDQSLSTLQDKAASVNGHCTLFRHQNEEYDVFQPLNGTLKQLHLNLKLAFDPHNILNPTRMYSDF